ncbi:hypothetical protein [Nostoc sp.]
MISVTFLPSRFLRESKPLTNLLGNHVRIRQSKPITLPKDLRFTMKDAIAFRR